jgi:hypothetical protein
MRQDQNVRRKEANLMTEFKGSFSGRSRALTVLSLSDMPDHELHAVEITGSHSSTDEKWNAARVTYWGMSDLIAGQGTQRGYFVNEHPAGDREWGTFQAKVTTRGDETTLEGTWSFSDGTGRFAGIQGSGTFKTRATSATEVQCAWEGSYKLAASVQAA